MYHLNFSVEGTNPEVIWNALLKYALPAAIIYILIVAAFYRFRKTKTKYVILTSSLVVSILLTGFAFYDAEKRISLVSNMAQDVFHIEEGKEGSADFIKANYVDPAGVEITFPEKKRNLIYIYLESMEVTYGDVENGGGFSKSRIPELTRLAEENENFSGNESRLNGGVSLPGSIFTGGALFAETSGAPLKTSLSGASFEQGDTFFPGITTLGDILKKEGYRQIFAIGSEGSFGARDTYFKTHGDYEIYDYNYAIENGRIPDGYFEWWGFEDEKLFAFAKEDLLKLSESDQPFNYTMLTVDTHFYDGYACELCDDEFEEPYSNAIACSSRQVVDFVEWAKQQDFYENTTIIISGDHPTMDEDYVQNLLEDKTYQRKTYTVIINSAQEDTYTSESYREYSTMDLFPTTIAALGGEIAGNHLGMGVNLYSDEPTLIEAYGLETCKKEMDKRSSYLEEKYNPNMSEGLAQLASENSTFSLVFEEKGKDKYTAYITWLECETLLLDNVDAYIKCMDGNKELSSMEMKFDSERGDILTCKIDFSAKDVKDASFTVMMRLGDSDYEIAKLSHKDSNNTFVESKDGNTIEVCFRTDGEIKGAGRIAVAVYSAEKNGEDANWYQAESVGEDTWKITIDRVEHPVEDDIKMDVYEQTNEGEAIGTPESHSLNLGELKYTR